MAKCFLCGAESKLVSSSVGVCVECLRRRPLEALDVAKESHLRWRSKVGLPLTPPRDPNGVRCSYCINECSIPPGERGFCGIMTNRGGILEPVAGAGKALLYAYLDPHPTNCVAGPVCPANTWRGYPEYTSFRGVERGFYNLAVFFAGCSLDCLFCQNWEHKTALAEDSWRVRGTVYVSGIEQLVDAAMDPRVTCVCYFGGDPGPHTPYAIAVSRIVARKAEKEGLIKRICWETNGLENPRVMREMSRLSMKTGGIVKIDWKAWAPEVYEALTGVNGRKAVERLKENVKIVASMMDERPQPPLLVISVLLVPGYVDVSEVRGIAEYVASVNPNIPLILLAFHPDHRMMDLPPTSRRHASEAVKAARNAGVKEVHIGNEWILGPYY